MTKLIGQLGGALREVKPESSVSDESMPEETPEQRAQRYMSCGQSEASDPDFWADVHYGPRSHEKEQNLMMAQDFRNSERQQGKAPQKSVAGGDETHHVAPVPSLKQNSLHP